jgi:hypothetical protein
VLQEEGFLDIIMRSADEEKSRECLWNVVRANAPALQKVVVMVLDRDGCVLLSGPALTDREAFDAALNPGPTADHSATAALNATTTGASQATAGTGIAANNPAAGTPLS